jgi:YggT family protein
VQEILCALVTAYILVIFLRVILSWIPSTGGGALSAVNRIVYDVTEPVLGPARRVIPPAGMFDLSATVVIIVLLVLRNIICS